MRERLAIEEEFRGRRRAEEEAVARAEEERKATLDRIEAANIIGRLFPRPREISNRAGLTFDRGGVGEEVESAPVTTTVDDFANQRERLSGVGLETLRGLEKKKIERDLFPDIGGARERPSRQSIRITQEHLATGLFPPEAKEGQFYDVFTDSSGKIYSVLREEKEGNLGISIRSAMQSLFPGRRLDSLNDEEQRQLEEFIDSRSRREAFSKAVGRVTGAGEMLTTPEQNRDYRILSISGDVIALPQGTSLNEAKRLRAVALTKKDSESLQSFETVESQLDMLDSLSKGIVTGDGGITTVASGVATRMKAATGYDDPARAYAAMVDASLGPLARGIMAERGVLTELDVERVRRALPKFTDSAKVRDFKMSALKLLLSQTKRTAKNVIFGLPYSREAWEKEKNAIIDSLYGKTDQATSTTPTPAPLPNGSQPSFKKFNLPRNIPTVGGR